jgi:hypothetical protein
MARLVLLGLILTEWGTFHCAQIRCLRDPVRGIRLYWSAPTLIVTKDHRPVLRRQCARLADEPATWDCRPSGQRPVESIRRGGVGE